MPASPAVGVRTQPAVRTPATDWFHNVPNSCVGAESRARQPD